MLQGVLTSILFKDGGDAIMNTYEVLTLLILNDTFIVALLAYLDNRNNKRK